MGKMRKAVRRFLIIIALIWACVLVLCLVIDPHGYGLLALFVTVLFVALWLAGNAKREKDRKTIYVRHLRDEEGCHIGVKRQHSAENPHVARLGEMFTI